MAFKPLPGRRGERVVQRDRLLTDETGRIDALLKTLDVQQDRLEGAGKPGTGGWGANEHHRGLRDGRGSISAIPDRRNETPEGWPLCRGKKQANREVQIRLLLELVDEMVRNSMTEWMEREAQPEEERTGACRDYDDFFSRMRYAVAYWMRTGE